MLSLGLDGLDVDLEGWGSDPNGRAYLTNLTLAARAEFEKRGPPPSPLLQHRSEAVPRAPPRMLISHAPEVPDFWRGNPYERLLADPAVLDAIDFLNLQFYNQIPFPDQEHIFTKDVYPPAAGAPSCLASIVAATVAASAGAVTATAVNQKLLLGFPCKDGSFPVGGANLNQCGAAQAQLVRTGVHALGYPLRGVFEWSASPPTLVPADLIQWNDAMGKALGGDTPTNTMA